MRANGKRRGRGEWGRGGLLLAAVPLALTCGAAEGPLPGADAPSVVALTVAGEPGEPLVVRGTVTAPDGETPVSGAVLYAWQTGADGRYGPPGSRTPRLRGWVRTDADGRYELRTVRPGSYPGGRNPAHIHFAAWGPGYPPQWSDDLLFADDPFVDAAERARSAAAGRFAKACSPSRDAQGRLVCTRDHRLKEEGDRFPPEVRHAFREGAGEAEDER